MRINWRSWTTWIVAAVITFSVTLTLDLWKHFYLSVILHWVEEAAKWLWEVGAYGGSESMCSLEPSWQWRWLRHIITGSYQDLLRVPPPPKLDLMRRRD